MINYCFIVMPSVAVLQPDDGTGVLIGMKTWQHTKTLTQILPYQTLGEEIANSLLHGFGALLGAAGLVLLVLRAQGFLGGNGGGGRATTSYVIFAAAMTCMFLASTLYHAHQRPEIKRIFRVFDHQAIYLFIAGTYTPLCLIGLRGPLGWTLFGIEWALAITGIVLYGVGCKALKKMELTVYLLMGWAIVGGCIPLARALPPRSLLLLAAGGVFYTLGTVWYALGRRRNVRFNTPKEPAPMENAGVFQKKSDRGAHVTWHVFVLLGALCHWWSIWFMS
ncbi:PAQR family membrane homeostasis protein TrhA [Leadbettera azotonutricia]|uniref:Hemolysin-3 n=1 Tax=Leadbettera azotonutricia (strain ATCC BAA-888 / DSM 13862 / ZAS-9) TaxID=545695 RepID=F5YA17_LEAAZ|nr:hemolysin III family protein [Leadbettera azotonutricia]AEF81478.1 hemolysin-3 [Leadbettera azotonutricia ZAS-9]